MPVLHFLYYSSSAFPLCWPITQANALLQQGRVDEAAQASDTTLSAQPGDPLAHQLLCRIDYSQDMADNAIRECELAVANAPSSSDNQMWLGRAYGYKASHANPITALSLAIKVRVAFERAVQLDPENIQAMNDLGQFYVSAPALIGGGLDKAEALAAEDAATLPFAGPPSARTHRGKEKGTCHR